MRSNLEDKKHFFVLNRCHSLVQWGDFFRAFGCRFSLLEVVSTATTTTVSVPVREEVLALGAGTIFAFVLLHTLATRSYDGMFRAQDDLVIIQIFASRGIITTIHLLRLIQSYSPFCFFGKRYRRPLRSCLWRYHRSISSLISIIMIYAALIAEDSERKRALAALVWYSLTIVSMIVKDR